MNGNKITLKKLILPTILLTTGVASSVILATKNDIQNAITKAQVNDATSSSSTTKSSKPTITETTIRTDFTSYQDKLKTTANTKLKYNAQMLYVQFGDYLANNLNKITTDIDSLTFNGTKRDVNSIIKSVVSDAVQSVWSSSNWTSSATNGTKYTQVVYPGNTEAQISRLKTIAEKKSISATATGGAPAIKFTSKIRGGLNEERILKSLDGFDNSPLKLDGYTNFKSHGSSGGLNGNGNSWQTADETILGGKLQNNSLFGTSLKNNSSRVVNFFSTKNKATSEVTSSNYVTTANNSWLNNKGVIYPWQQDTSTGWYKNTSMTTRNIGDYLPWATNYLDSYISQFETTDETTTFGTSNSIQTATFKIGKTQSQVLNADNVSVFFRMYVNTNNQQDTNQASTYIDGRYVSNWYSNNYINDSDTTRVMSGTTTYLGDTSAVETIQNINYDLSSLIQVDSNSSTYLNSLGKVYTTTAPTMKFTWNLDLFAALKEAKQIAELVKTIESDTTLTQNQKNKFATEVYPALQKGLCDLSTLNNYYEQVKSVSIANPIFTPLGNEASYWTTINKFNWNLPTSSSTSNAAKIIQSWGDAYSVILPKIFTNDISVEMKVTGSNSTQRVTIYQADGQTWKTITAVDNGQQLKTFNNNVTLTFSNFKVTNATTGKDISSKGLVGKNVLNNTPVNENQKINLDNNSNLAITFAYNPSLDGLIQKIEPQRTAQTLSLKALYDTGVYVSDIDENLSDSIRDQFATDTKNQLLIPDSLINSVGTSYKGGKTIFDMGSSFKVPKASSMNPTILNSAAAVDLKKYLNLRNTYTEANSKYSMDQTETNAQTVVSAMKDLDNLGYYYLEVWSKMPIDYYSTKDSYDELQKDKTFVNIGYEGGYYGYYVKYAATKKPLNIDDLSKYVNITKSVSTSTTNSDINELTTVNSVKSQLDSLNTQLSDVTSRLDSLLQSSTTIQSDITTLNTQIESLLNDLVNNNPELAAAANEIDVKYQTQIDAITQKIDTKKQEFDKNKNFTGGGFVKHLNKTLDYTNELQDLTNSYENKLNELGTLFTNSAPVIKVQKEVQTMTSNVMTRVNNVTSEINSLTKELNSLSDLNTTLTTQLANINKLTYTTTTTNTTKFSVNFSLPLMKSSASLDSSTGNSDLTSFYSMLSENKLSNYFYVTKAQFASKLNELIKTQTGVDPQLTADTITYNSDSGVTVGNNNYNFTYDKNGDVLNTLVFNIELNDINSKVNEVTVNNAKVKESDLVQQNTNLSTINSTDATTLLTNIATYKTTLQKNQTTILNSINKLSSSLTDLTEKASNINEYNNAANLYPSYLKTQATLNEVKEQLTNYTPTTVSETQLNSMLIGVLSAAIVGLLIVIIGLTIRIRSKRHIKTKAPTTNDAEIIDKFTKAQEEDKTKENKGF